MPLLSADNVQRQRGMVALLSGQELTLRPVSAVDRPWTCWSSSGAMARIGGLLSCQPSALAIGTNSGWRCMRKRVSGSFPHQPP